VLARRERRVRSLPFLGRFRRGSLAQLWLASGQGGARPTGYASVVPQRGSGRRVKVGGGRRLKRRR